jgi:hypothetical protein
MNRLFRVVAVGAIVPMCTVLAQEGLWTLSGGAGYAFISLGAVKADLDRDVRGYNEVGLEIPGFPSPSPGIAFTAAATYRFDREYSFALNAYHDSRTVETSWSNAEDALSLKRRIKASVVSAGLLYHFPTDMDSDLFAEVEIGMLFARATSYALWTHTEKISDSSLVYTTEVLDNTVGVFEKSKLIVSGGIGGSIRVFGPMFLRGKMIYRFGQIGQIDGSKTDQYGQTVDQTTSIDFNFSGFLFLASVGIELY